MIIELIQKSRRHPLEYFYAPMFYIIFSTSRPRKDRSSKKLQYFFTRYFCISISSTCQEVSFCEITHNKCIPCSFFITIVFPCIDCELLFDTSFCDAISENIPEKLEFFWRAIILDILIQYEIIDHFLVGDWCGIFHRNSGNDLILSYFFMECKYFVISQK